MKLPPDATIENVWYNLARRHDYVDGVLKKLNWVEQKFGQAVVRIGVTGSGQKPYYWIMRLDEDGNRIPVAAYFDNHTQFAAEQKAAVEGPNWSTKHMTLQELQSFYTKAGA